MPDPVPVDSVRVPDPGPAPVPAAVREFIEHIDRGALRLRRTLGRVDPMCFAVVPGVGTIAIALEDFFGREDHADRALVNVAMREAVGIVADATCIVSEAWKAHCDLKEKSPAEALAALEAYQKRFGRVRHDPKRREVLIYVAEVRGPLDQIDRATGTRDILPGGEFGRLEIARAELGGPLDGATHDIGLGILVAR